MLIPAPANDHHSENDRISVYIAFYQSYLIAKDMNDLASMSAHQRTLENWVSGSKMTDFEIKKAKGLAITILERMKIRGPL